MPKAELTTRSKALIVIVTALLAVVPLQIELGLDTFSPRVWMGTAAVVAVMVATYLAGMALVRLIERGFDAAFQQRRRP
jgi:protein-S-isoprenylcysteine O-methyltransferase Ste14